eukprot:PhF_6_TR24924/c0_g1_i1/m.34309/K18588/COQ10; coenzyme Q-binding protein COQ10
MRRSLQRLFTPPPLSTTTTASATSILGATLPTAGIVQRYNERCIFGYRPDHVFAVVADVGAYPSFLPWCTSSIVHSAPPPQPATAPYNMDATLRVGFLMYNEKYTSKVVLVPQQTIDATLSGKSTVLKHLTCNWSFQPYTKGCGIPEHAHPQLAAMAAQDPKFIATIVNFGVVFEFHNPVHTKLSGLFLSQIVEKMTKSFEDRCRTLHGTPTIKRTSLV